MPRASAGAKPLWRKPPFIAAASVLAVVLALVGAVSWDQWLRYNDAADFQGMWYPDGSSASIQIDGSTIRLSSDVSYSYELDTTAKTIRYTFGPMSGEGRYRFSLDRTQLVITDGEAPSWSTTLFDDLGWKLSQFVASVQGQAPERAHASDGVTVFDREPSIDIASVPKTGALSSGGTGSSSEGGGDADGAGSANAAGDGAGQGSGTSASGSQSGAGVGTAGAAAGSGAASVQ